MYFVILLYEILYFGVPQPIIEEAGGISKGVFLDLALVMIPYLCATMKTILVFLLLSALSISFKPRIST